MRENMKRGMRVRKILQRKKKKKEAEEQHRQRQWS